MKPFTVHRGIVAALNRANVDTDQIIPKQFLKRIQRTGFGEFLFYDWKHRLDGSINPDFELNQPQFAGATILLAGTNFGCGSSREHAPWALLDFGFRCIIAPSFSDIFFNNCLQNGMLPVRLTETEVAQLFELCKTTPGFSLTVDLTNQRISDEAGNDFRFDMDAFRRHCLLNGLDEIGLTNQFEDHIRMYEQSRI